MRVYLSNLGCKLNQAEIEAFGRDFARRGHHVVSSLEDAEVHVINTCTVTHIADRSSRKLARRGSRTAGGVRTVLTGCYATASPDEAAGLAGVDLIVANADKAQLVEAVEATFPELLIPKPNADFPYGASALAAGRARAAVKIEDGCNMRCSFCIIPFTRGAQTSRDPDAVVEEVRALVAAGLLEVVLTGVQISSYRWQQLRLVDLVERVLAVIGDARLRLTSIAPWAFDPGLLALLADGSICPHIHLSLQSGCDRTLEQMKRPYTVHEYEALVEDIRSTQRDTAITTDVIVGFPGETDDDFETSLSTVGRIGFARTHVFPYSSRPGTAAASMPEQVDAKTRTSRMRRMLAAARRAEAAFEDGHLGRERQVLWEGVRDGAAHGTTDNYLKVLAGEGQRRPDDSLENERLSRGADGLLWAVERTGGRRLQTQPSIPVGW